MARQRYTKEFKQQVIKEAQSVGNVAQVAKRYELATNMVYRWIRDEKTKSFQATPNNAKKNITYVPSPGEFRKLEDENDHLKKILGEKDLEIAILRDLVKKANPGFQTK